MNSTVTLSESTDTIEETDTYYINIAAIEEERIVREFEKWLQDPKNRNKIIGIPPGY